MQNLFKNTSEIVWWPDVNDTGATDNKVPRCDNTIPQRDGARTLRYGSVPLYTGLQDQRIHSIYSALLQGTSYRMFGGNNRVYSNGLPLSGDFDGEGDIVFGDDSYQAFAARGTIRKKWDGSMFHNWTVAAPILPATLTAVNAITTEVASFGSAESPAFVSNEGITAVPGTPDYVTGQSGASNGAIRLTPDLGTGRASISKKFASDQNFLHIGGAEGSGTDLFDFRIWMEDWRKIDKITIMFGLGTGTDPYVDDYYYFDWNIRNPDTVNIKDAASQSAAAYKLASSKAINVLSPQEVTNVRSATEAAAILRRLGRFAGPRSTERRDAQEASPAWGHLAVTRGQFNRVGGTSGRNWTTIRAFKVVYTTIPGSTEVAYFDDAIWTGGGSRSLTGNFTVGYRFARRFVNAAQQEVYFELSPMSPISSEITLNQQTLQVKIPATALASKDPQVTEIWAYLQGGWLDTYYRFAVLPASVNTGMTPDEITFPVGADFNTPEKRTRLTTWGFTVSEGMGAGSADLFFTGGISEVEILIDNEPYVPGSMNVPEDIIGIAGPWNGRMFLLTREGFLHPSSGTSPSDYSAYHSIDLRRYGTPLWVVNTSGGIMVGCSKDIIRIAGSGDESEDRVTVDLYGDPLNVGNPPVDDSVMVDGNTIIYRSADGYMILSGGASLTPLPFAGTYCLWRGEGRHGIPALNLNGRFRVENDNHILYALVPEGESDPTAIWAMDLNYDPRQWCRFTYPFTPLCIFKEPGGKLLVGTDDGAVWEIEVGSQDDTAGINVDITTSFSDGGDPLRRKQAVDLQLHVDTGGTTGTIEFAQDGVITPISEVEFATPGSRVFRADLTSFGKFLKARTRIKGSFTQFALQAFNVTFRRIPQQVMALDTGYIVIPGRDMAWITEVELDVISSGDLQILIYRDDVYWRTETVSITPGVRFPYRKTMPRGTKAHRLRLLVKAVNAAGYENPGFEPYSFKYRARGSGNFTELAIVEADAA